MSDFDHPFWRLQHAIGYLLLLGRYRETHLVDTDALGILIRAQREVLAESEVRRGQSL